MVELHIARLYTSGPVELPVIVHHAKQGGPTLFVSAALHGDELNGVEIIRRLLRSPEMDQIRGTLLAVPIINPLAVIHQSRYLPDRRDLNRSFPGSDKGSFAARLANLFLTEVVQRCDYGIDLHTGAIHRPNLPQIRADLSQPKNLRMAKAFGAPLFLDSKPAAGTLREYTTQQNIPVILYEAGEALRFDETAIRIGVQGVLNVMQDIGMLDAQDAANAGAEPIRAHSSRWLRSPASGMLRAQVDLGESVRRGQVVAVVGDPYGDEEENILAPADGVIIGRSSLPLVHEGDAVFHLANTDEPDLAAEVVEQVQAEALEQDSDEPPIV